MLSIQDPRMFLPWIWQASGHLCRGGGQRASFKEVWGGQATSILLEERAGRGQQGASPATDLSGTWGVTSSSKMKGAGLDGLFDPFQL